jgi:FkbM family methyltransferase
MAQGLKPSMTDEALARAATLRAQGQLEQAADVLAAVLRQDEGAHAARYQLSEVEAQLGHLASAERLAREAAAAGGDSYARGLGCLLGQLGKLEEAETWLLRALQHDAQDALAYADLAAVYADQCRLMESMTCLERALSIQPDFPWVKSTQKALLARQAFLNVVRDTYSAFARDRGLNPDPDAMPHSKIEFPSAALASDGEPRFVMSIPSALVVRDLGAAHLFIREVAGQGYESGLRRLLDHLLEPDDVFIDVGAHWGIHSLSAATRFPKDLRVLALEANSENSRRLVSWVELNNLESEIEVIPKAVGDRVGIAHLSLDGSSMGHRIASNGVEVDMTTLDQVLAERDWLRWRRVILKVDVEGHEMEVFSGAQQLFSQCRVAAVVWEKSEFHEAVDQAHRTSTILDFLSVRGFRHYRLEDEDHANSLVALGASDGACNVVSVASAQHAQ